MFTLVSLCSAAVIRLYCWSVLRREVRWGEAGTSCVRMSWSKGDFRDRSPERKTVCKTWCNTIALCAHRDGRRQIWEKSSRWTNIFIMYCNVTPIKISNPQPSLRNFVNFVAVACEKQLDLHQASLTHFFSVLHFEDPHRGGGYVLHVALFVTCFSSFSIPPLSSSSPLSHDDMLEVIITIASGFISIYSHNNTEKEKTDSTGVMYYLVWESSFIMTSNGASSLYLFHSPARTHTSTHTFFISLSLFALPSVHPLLSRNPWCSQACKFVPHYHKLWW